MPTFPLSIMTYVLPDLPYPPNALEPHIDVATMEIHHGKHHAGYVTKLNAALGDIDTGGKSVEELLADIDMLPEEVQTAVRNNGGGHANHCQFWTALSPNGGGSPEGALLEGMIQAFGSFDAFKEAFTKEATTRFGSGWAWLVLEGGQLNVSSTPNQDSPILSDQTPLLGLDVWEHAYYLNYQNKRPDYIEAFWNLVDWGEVSRRYEDAL